MDEKLFELLSDETLTEINDNLKLIQKKGGLTFGSDALLLASFVKKPRGAVAMDLGSGTGVIALLAASRGNFKKIYAVEIQQKFADIIGRNARLNGLDDTVEPICADLRDVKLECDIVFSNPPYMKTSSGKSSDDDGRDIARRERNGGIYDFCECASRCLSDGGDFYVVYRPDRMVDLLCALRENKLEPKKLIFVCADENHAPSLVLVSAKKGAAPSLIVPKPLFLNLGGEMSQDAKKIYESGKLDL